MRSKPVVTAILMLLSSLAMADDSYLQIDGIKGDSKAAGHKDWIDITAFENQIDSPGGPGAAGQPAGRPIFKKFRICKSLDRATVPIQGAAAKATPIASAKVEVVSQGRVTLRYEFTNVRLEDFYISWEKPEKPIDCVSLTFEKLTVTYITYDDDGKATENPIEIEPQRGTGN